MSSLPERVDVVVVGAGTAGAATARFVAQAGLSVLCVERGALAEAGARWINGVALSAFDAAGLSRPTGDEARGHGHAFHFVAGRGPARVVIDDHEVADVDMGLFVGRVQAAAREAGAVLEGGVEVHGVSGHVVDTSRGRVTTAWVVDASGHGGARLARVPPVDRRDLCVAAQQVRHVRDRGAAEAFFAAHGVPTGDTLCFTALDGGYSILNVRLAHDRLFVLTGSIPAEGHAGGQAIADTFAAEQSWVGDIERAGARAIPLRRPFDRLAHGPVALVGDAGCQVFSAHGSGIAAGLAAARLFAEALAADEGAAGYEHRWHTRYGGLYATYDLFRRFSQSLAPRDIAALIEAGVLEPIGALAALEMRVPLVPPHVAARQAAGLLRVPRLGARVAAMLARAASAHAVYAAHPTDPARLRLWSHAVARATATPVDPG